MISPLSSSSSTLSHRTRIGVTDNEVFGDGTSKNTIKQMAIYLLQGYISTGA